MGKDSALFTNNMLVTTIISLVFLMFIIPASLANAQSGGFTGDYNPGGFTGPGPDILTTEQASKMMDDAPVALKGNIIKRLNDDRYTFQDSAGTIEIKVKHKDWRGVSVGPEDTVTIMGKVKKDWSGVRVDVKMINKE